MNSTVRSTNPRGEGVAAHHQTRKGEFRMLKRKLTALIFAATLCACSAVVPAFAQENGQTMQNDNMSGSKMKDDKMAGDKMSSKKRKHRKSRKHKAGHKMADDKMQGDKKP